MKRVNELLMRVRHQDDGEFLWNFVQTQRTKISDGTSRLTESDLFDQCVDHLVSNLGLSQNIKAQEMNRVVSTSIHEFEKLGKWTNLNAIAAHAIAAELVVLKHKAASGCDLSKTLLPMCEFKAYVFGLGHEDLTKLMSSQTHPCSSVSELG